VTDPIASLRTETIVLTGADLTIADVEAVARHGAHAVLDDAARARMQESRDVIERLVTAGEVVYGVTTGFGDLATRSVAPADARRLQENLLMSHAAGVGAALDREIVRAMLLLRANTLALGHSGCRPAIVDGLLALLDKGLHPVVPEQGSVGASGDLAPLAHLALPLIGRGRVELGAISERRTALLLDARLNGGLPAFLAPATGLDSGMMIYQYTAAALASENKVLVHPASADSVPTSANQEDHVSMGPIAARHGRTVLWHVEKILAIELVVAAQALDFRLRLQSIAAAQPGAGVAEAHSRIRTAISHLDTDREPGPDLDAATRLVHGGAFSDLAG
jgi:histidine ammonia-lyase